MRRMAATDRSAAYRPRAHVRKEPVRHARIRGNDLGKTVTVQIAHLHPVGGAVRAPEAELVEGRSAAASAVPNPRRTIIGALWNGEEQGLNGSRAFVEDNPGILERTHTVFNVDHGNGPVTFIPMQGFAGAAGRESAGVAGAGQDSRASWRIFVYTPSSPRRPDPPSRTRSCS